MKRLWLLAAAHLALGAAWAQESVAVTVDAGCAAYFVDGTLYMKAATFAWQVGSRHYLSIELNQDDAGLDRPGGIRCAAADRWKDNLDRSYPGTTSITVDPAVTSYVADSTISYKVELSIQGVNGRLKCDPLTPSPPDPWLQPDYGYVYFNGTCQTESVIRYMSPGTVLEFSAHPPKGFVFKGWTVSSLAGIQASNVLTLVVDRPLLIVPWFSPAARVHFQTEPAGMQLLVDRTPVTGPFETDWEYDVPHWMASLSPQMDERGSIWVFDSWSDSGDDSHTFTPTATDVHYYFTVKYAPGFRVGFNTSPLGLKLIVDGVERSGLNFFWKMGTQHTVSAPAEQAGADGRRYVFTRWSNDGPPEQHVTVTGHFDEGFIGYFDVLGKLTLKSPGGPVAMLVDGQSCTTPCEIHRPAGAKVTIAAPASRAFDDGGRLDFQGWADGGPAERVWTAGGDAVEMVANYQMKYRLNAVASPAGSAEFRFEPGSSDGYYPVDTEVKVTVTAKEGYRFWYWEGDLTGGSRSGMVWLGQARSVQAFLTKVDAYGPAAVRNAAGETPEPEVAPGSLVTLFGPNLTGATEQGPADPLAQTIGGTTVQVGDRFLPLVFVSPEQINAQLFSDLPEGEHTLLITNPDRPDITGKFKVRRNAPGLFSRTVEEKAFVSAFHADGTQVTAESPAKRNEVITILGTGFGPYKQGAVDGFAVPKGVVMELEDAVEIRAGDLVVKPESAAAAEEYTGTVALKLKIADPLPKAATVEIFAVVGGHASNKVLLPLE